jgi:hypothetical protein
MPIRIGEFNADNICQATFHLSVPDNLRLETKMIVTLSLLTDPRGCDSPRTNNTKRFTLNLRGFSTPVDLIVRITDFEVKRVRMVHLHEYRVRFKVGVRNLGTTRLLRDVRVVWRIVDEETGRQISMWLHEGGSRKIFEIVWNDRWTYSGDIELDSAPGDLVPDHPYRLIAVVDEREVFDDFDRTNNTADRRFSFRD